MYKWVVTEISRIKALYIYMEVDEKAYFMDEFLLDIDIRKMSSNDGPNVDSCCRSPDVDMRDDG